jgi:hypothetical protein
MVICFISRLFLIDICTPLQCRLILFPLRNQYYVVLQSYQYFIYSSSVAFLPTLTVTLVVLSITDGITGLAVWNEIQGKRKSVFARKFI